MHKPAASQLDLFGTPAVPVATEPHAVLPAAPDGSLQVLARRLPAGIRLGTSSWHFPGWARLVYDRAAEERILAREGLTAYVRHPLFGCVSLDRTFHGPIPQADYRRYAAQVPPAFRFLVKGPLLVTAPVLRPSGASRGQENARFLDAAAATEGFVLPCVAGLEEKAGPLVFQFPSLGREWTSRPRLFAHRLHDFLVALPLGPVYAVELRDRALLGPDYLDALRNAGAIHCLSVHPRMPVASEQAREAGLDRSGALVVRWNLHAGFTYEEAKARYAPFNALVDEDILNRVGLARLALAAARRGDAVYVTANNEAEGSAPLTIVRLAEQIVAAAGHAQA